MKKRCDRLVLADGVFDPIHIGHVRYLAAAALSGTRLLVRIAPDAVIRAKGRQPFQTQTERALVIGQFKCVDDVCTDETLEAAIRAHRPAYLVKGCEWQDRLPPAIVTACDAVGTRIKFTQTSARTSTERLAG